AFLDGPYEARGEIRRILRRPHPRHGHPVAGDQLADQRDRPWRSCEDLDRPRPQPQPELQHVETRFRILPFGHLVAPGGIELRTAKTVWLRRREDLGYRPILPHQPAAARLVARTVSPCHRENPGRTLDHHFAHVIERFPDERDPSVFLVGKWPEPVHERVHPLRAEP